MMRSLYIGASGLKTLGEGMNVVSNNLANVNTVGFKKTMMLYQDLLSQPQMARSNGITNMSQAGMGSRVGDTRKVFIQGGMESGSAATDMGIEGLGFFGVEKNGTTHFTRAGNFRFTAEGELKDPSGWTLLGYKIESGKTQAATPSPISLDMTPGSAQTYMAPKATTSLSTIVQLGKLTNSDENATNPFFSMLNSWDATQTPSLTATNYSYKQPVSFYDSNGKIVTATMYFDLAGEQNGSKVVEYILALDPEGAQANAGDGLLMAGTLTFDATGQISNMTGFTPPSGDHTTLSNWVPAPLQNGAPAFMVTPPGGNAQTISLNMGLTLATTSAGLTSAADAAFNPTSIYQASPGASLQANYSHSRGSSNGSISLQRDGYTEGSLVDMHVTSDGLVTGRFSNGQNMDLYRVPLFRFTSQDGLYREGGNHFSATSDSGEGVPGVAGTENYGTIAERSLETSNVDYSEEFVYMISTQRGFQMNSKVITTSDAMLQKALELKR